MSASEPLPKLPQAKWISPTQRLAYFLGVGFGSGLLRPAPGTWGSVVGFGYAFVLLHHFSFGAVVGITLAGILISIPICGVCERLLAQPDPSCVVLDEICCAPLALLPAFGLTLAWWQWLIAFVVYRVADIVKPFPARRAEKLPEGWGIVLDDVVSSLYMCGLWFLGQAILRRS